MNAAALAAALAVAALAVAFAVGRFAGQLLVDLVAELVRVEADECRRHQVYPLDPPRALTTPRRG